MQKASSPRQSNANIRERFSQTEKASFQMSSNNFSKNSLISTDRNSYINPSQINNEKSGLLGASNYSFTQATSIQNNSQTKKVPQKDKSPRQSNSNTNNTVKGFSLFDKSPRQSAPNIMDTATSPTEKRVRHPTPIGSHKNSVSSITDNKSPRQSTPDYGAKRNLFTIEKVLTIEKVSSPKAGAIKKSRPETPKERASENSSDIAKSYEALNKRFNDSKVAKNQTGLTISTLMDEFTELRKNFNKQSEEARPKPAAENTKVENQLKVSQAKISPIDDLKKENENIKKTLEFLQNENEALRRTVADVNKYQKEVSYYKGLAESRLKDSSTLAEEIIFLRTTLDKSHFNYLKVQKSQTTPTKVGIESSPLEVRRSSLRSEKSKDSSSKKVRWRDELESNN